MGVEVPPLRVSRPVSACARCRNAKIKCDGKLPACSACERVGKAKECSSANDQFAKGKERSYVAALESRIERLQRQVGNLRTDGDMSRTSNLASTPAAGIKHAQRKDASDVDDLVSDFGYLSVNATASGYHGFTQEMSFARLVLSTSGIAELPQPPVATLPSRELAVILVKECLERVLSIYPVFSDTQVFGSMEAIYQHNGRYCPPRDCWNVRLVMAIASLLRSKSKGDVQYQHAISHAALALEQREAVLQPGYLSTVQALLLLTIYSTLDPAHFDSWYLIGVAARVMVDIGLHQDPEHGVEAPSRLTTIETRRRVFYCVYALDRVVSMTHIRCLSFSDDSINVALPNSSLSLNELGHPVDHRVSCLSTIEIMRFRQIQSSAYHELFGSSRKALSAPWQTRIQLIRRLRDWISGLPESTPDSLKQLLLSEMYYLDVLLMRPQGRDTDAGPYGTALLLEYCIGFVRNTRLICDKSWTFGYCSALDFKRTEFVAQITLEILLDEATPLFQAGDLQSPPVQFDESLPPLQRSTLPEKITQSINALVQLEEVTEILCQKFGKSKLYDNQKRHFAVALQKLYMLHQRHDQGHTGNGGPSNATLLSTAHVMGGQWTRAS